MSPTRAIFIALDAIFRVVETREGRTWEVDPRIPGLLRDYAALGLTLIGILDSEALGGDVGDGRSLTERAKSALSAAGAPALAAVYVPEDLSDPRPLWELRRRFGVVLERSILLADGERYEVLRHNADIGHFESARELLGPAWVSAAA